MEIDWKSLQFKEATNALFQRLENGEIIFVVSDLLDLELINAPQLGYQMIEIRSPKDLINYGNE